MHSNVKNMTDPFEQPKKYQRYKPAKVEHTAKRVIIISGKTNEIKKSVITDQ